MLRVISGNAKGCKLKTLKGLTTRPTTDKVKGSIFSILGGYIDNLDVIDLFAGSGNLGIEALSRGAKSSIFVEKSFECCNIINDNLLKTKLNHCSKVQKSDVIRFLDNYNAENGKCDIVFMDPPYNDDIVLKTLMKIDHLDILNVDGIIVLEKHTKHILDYNFKNFSIIKEKVYGQTSIVLYKKV